MADSKHPSQLLVLLIAPLAVAVTFFVSEWATTLLRQMSIAPLAGLFFLHYLFFSYFFLLVFWPIVKLIHRYIKPAGYLASVFVGIVFGCLVYPIFSEHARLASFVLAGAVGAICIRWLYR